MVRYPILLLDADNTLFDFTKAEAAAVRDVLGDEGIVASEEMIQTYSRINDGMWKKLERGETTKARLRIERFEEFCAHYKIDTDILKMADTYTAYLTQKDFLLEGALEVCRELATCCKLYIITNGAKEVQRGRLSGSPLLPYISEMFVSEEIGFEKPHRGFFERVAEKIPNFDPGNVLVVGDSLSSDIAGGKAFGLDTCYFCRGTLPADPKNIATYIIRHLGELPSLVRLP